MQPINDSGIFWIPGTVTELSGRLDFDAIDGCKIELVGDFDDVQFDQSSVLIWGYIGSKRVTLRDCWKTRLQQPSRGVVESAYHVGGLFIGSHMSEDDNLFDRVLVKFGELGNWVGSSGIKYRVQEEDDDTSSIVSMSLDSMLEDEANFSRGCIRVFQGWSTKKVPNGSVLYQHSYIEIKYDSPATFQTITGDVVDIEQLISMCADVPLTMDLLKVFRDHANEPTAETSPSNGSLQVEYKASRIHHVEPTDKDRIPRYDRYLSYREIDGVDGMAKWLDVVPEFRRSLHALSGVRYMGKTYMENRLLNVISAAEGFHRNVYQVPETEQESHRQLIQTLLEAVPDEDSRDWINDKLAYAYEPSLKKRLMKLAGRSKRAIKVIIPDKYKWAHVVASARNEVTHVNSDVDTIDSEDMLYLHYSVFDVVRANMLLSLGVSIGLLESASDRYCFSWYKDRLRGTIDRLHARYSQRLRQASLC